MRVALLGPDGAGKSTLSSGLEGSFIFPVRTIYMGLTGGLLPWADRLRFPPLVVPARLAIFWYRYVRGRYEQMRGRLVIFDRYVYDSRVPHPRQLSRLERAVRWIDGHSVPGPDLVLVLSAPGDVMHARKGEYSSETLELWRRHFLALRERIPNLEIVDTTQDPEAVRAEVTQRIWNRYRARWRVSPVEPGT
jgi:thymidylate kinase